MNQVWMITGANRGLGAAIAKAALAAGAEVVATGRDVQQIHRALGESPKLAVYALDVANEAQVADVVHAATTRFGRIDVLVNNAGYGHLQVFEETTSEDVHKQFETNVFGLMAVTRQVMSGMRERRQGRIFNISSISGRKGAFGSALYSASKFAVEGFSQSIADELAPFNVFVTSVSPGFFRTDFLDQSSAHYGITSRIDDYADAVSAFRAFTAERNHAQSGDPDRLAQVLLQLASSDRPPVSFVVGTDAVEYSTMASQEQLTTIEAWRSLSVSTDGDWS